VSELTDVFAQGCAVTVINNKNTCLLYESLVAHHQLCSGLTPQPYGYDIEHKTSKFSIPAYMYTILQCFSKLSPAFGLSYMIAYLIGGDDAVSRMFSKALQSH
jgi:hypothetical protein